MTTQLTEAGQKLADTLDTAPEDEAVILFTTGDWVGEASMLRDEDTGEKVWTWANGTPVHPNHTPLAWQQMPSLAPKTSAPGTDAGMPEALAADVLHYIQSSESGLSRVPRQLLCRVEDVLRTGASLSPPTGSAGDDETGVREDCRLWWFLKVLQGAGGTACANGDRWDWTNAFCDDRGEYTDTFNLASDRKLTTVSHDSDSGNSTVYITDAGCEYSAHQIPRVDTSAGVNVRDAAFTAYQAWGKRIGQFEPFLAGYSAALASQPPKAETPAGVGDRPAGAIHNGRENLRRLAEYYTFKTEEGGSLAMCADYHDAVRCFEALADYVSLAPAARAGDGVERYKAGAMDMRDAAANAISAAGSRLLRDKGDALCVAVLGDAALMIRALPLTAAPAANGKDA